MGLVRQIIADYPGLSVNELSLTVCELLEWKRPNGRLKSHECRIWLRQLDAKGVLSLPELRFGGKRGPHRIESSQRGDAPGAEINANAGDLEPLRLDVVASGSEDSAVFREWLHRYHYMAYKVPVGANLRYVVRSGEGQELACLQWSSPAWKMAARDAWIGWSIEQRERALQYIVNNSRFLIL